MSDSTASKPYSFYTIFDDFEALVIPPIQREYAQGREGREEDEVRKSFLATLFDDLDGDTSSDLDFVYGYTRDDGALILLDGQQRLTTLFLLHWYLASACGDEDLKKEFRDRLTDDNGRSRFRYETRQGATDFCNALMKEDNLLEGLEEDQTPSSVIRDQHWYHWQWDQDPTIKAILIMLDAIHVKYEDHEEKRKNHLKNLLDGRITFKFLDLGSLKLTDSLYIRMNSRGKPLTPFEKFKASFGGYLKERRGDEALAEYGDDPGQYFLRQADTAWLDMMWKLSSDKDRKDATFDKYFSDLIRNLLIFAPAALADWEDEEEEFPSLKFLAEYFLVKHWLEEAPSFQEYCEIGEGEAEEEEDPDEEGWEEEDWEEEEEDEEAEEDEEEGLGEGIFTPKVCAFLIRALDAIADRIKESSEPPFALGEDEKKTLKNALTHNFGGYDDSPDFYNYGEAFAFYAWLRFLMEHPLPDGSTTSQKKEWRNSLKEWMRVIRNLTRTENVETDDISWDNSSDFAWNWLDKFASFLQGIEILLPKAGGILQFLAKNGEWKKYFPNTWQVREEEVKAALLLLDSPEWTTLIKKYEDNPYFLGQIGFILEFSGIYEHFTKHKNKFNSPEEEKKLLKAFRKYGDRVAAIFDRKYGDKRQDTEYLFERAVMTKGDYVSLSQLRGSKGEETYGHKSLGWEDNHYPNLYSVEWYYNNGKERTIGYRKFSWRRLLRCDENNYDKNRPWQKKRRGLVKRVLDDIDEADPRGSLRAIVEGCKTPPESWLKPFIDNPELFKYANNGFIGDFWWENKTYKGVLILKKFSKKSEGVEIYTYHLWTKTLEKCQDEFSPLVGEYMDKAANDKKCIPYILYKYSNKDYVEINAVVEEDGSLANYKVLVYPNDEKALDKFLREGFRKPKGEGNRYYYAEKNSVKDIKAILKAIAGELQG